MACELPKCYPVSLQVDDLEEFENVSTVKKYIINKIKLVSDVGFLYGDNINYNTPLPIIATGVNAQNHILYFVQDENVLKWVNGRTYYSHTYNGKLPVGENSLVLNLSDVKGNIPGYYSLHLGKNPPIFATRSPEIQTPMATPMLQTMATPMIPTMATPMIPTMATPMIPTMASTMMPTMAIPVNFGPTIPSSMTPSMAPTIPFSMTPSMPPFTTPKLPAVSSGFSWKLFFGLAFALLLIIIAVVMLYRRSHQNANPDDLSVLSNLPISTDSSS